MFPLTDTHLVWSDPEDVDTWAISQRGAGWLFGAKVVSKVTSLRPSYSTALLKISSNPKLMISTCIRFPIFYTMYTGLDFQLKNGKAILIL